MLRSGECILFLIRKAYYNAFRLYLTEKGKEMQPVLVGERERFNDEILSSLTLEEKVLLKRLLKDLQLFFLRMFCIQDTLNL